MQKALTYPFEETGKIRHVIGSLLVFFSFLIIPLIYLIGYFIKAMTFSSTGREEPPEFTEFKSITKLGGIGFLISFAYTGFLIGLPLLLISLLMPYIYSPNTPADAVFLINALGVLLFGIVLIAAAILPVVLCQLGRTGDHTTLYNIPKMKSLILTPEVLKAMVYSISLGAITLLLTGGLVLITFGIGLFIVPAITFWFLLATAHIYGTAIGKATGTITPTRYTDVVNEIQTSNE